MVSARTTENSTRLGDFFFSFLPFRNDVKSDLKALIATKLFGRIDGGFGPAGGHRSNGLTPRRARNEISSPSKAMKGDVVGALYGTGGQQRCVVAMG